MPGPIIDLTIYDSEEQLLAGLRRREPDACACLIKRFAPLVYAQSLRLLGDPDEAESVLQQTFIKACARLDGYEGRSGLGSWLYRIATNEALMQLRRHAPRVALDDVAETIQADEIPQRTTLWSLDPATAALDGELRAELEKALAALPETLRVVFVLREIQGLSTDETAAALGLGESAVKVRLHRARLRLRELLATYMLGH
ncbi:MAG: sigma-70 family RNA polymerase sigma factor [Chloroflexi bacterium]|nr:sigma-70 family RNA polymerase sigma factor [Chloroflexota bacterium]